MTPHEIHPATRLGPVHLTVANLEQQAAFYQQAMRMTLHWQKDGQAGLGAGGEDLLVLTEEKGALRYRGTTGLYHFAVLVPDRRELAKSIAHLAQLRIPQAPTDHIFTETTYLNDPEGNGIEIYVDTPEDGSWGMEGDRVIIKDKHGNHRSMTEQLDVDELFTNLQPGDRFDTPLPPETKMGHIHLHVADIDASAGFYRDLLGFGEQMYGYNVSFVSAGGYHHHIGMNTWAGEGAPPPPPGATGLRYFTVVLPDQAELDRLEARLQEAGVFVEKKPEGLLIGDPSQNGVLLTV